MGLLSCPPGQPVWDGVDFIPCFRDRFLSFLLPLVLVGGSLVVALLYRIVQLSNGSEPAIQLPISSAGSPPASAASPVALEAEVLRRGARAVYGTEPEEAKSTVEVVRDIGMLGLLLGLLALELVRALGSPAGSLTGWGGVALSAFLLALSLITALDRTGTTTVLGFHSNQLEAHRSTLLIAYGAFTFVNLRSSIIGSAAQDLLNDSLASAAVLALVLLDICTPYRAQLDGALEGHRARGAAFHRARAARSPEGGDGGTGSSASSSFKPAPPPGLEEPRSLFARATFTYMNPLIFRHFRRPITEGEIPDLREDDRAAVVVAGWRAWRERSLAGLGEDERAKVYVKGSLSWALVKFFQSYFLLQGFWSAVFVLCSFIAPWTLKSILEFVAYRKLSNADPETYPPQPTHLAVAYLLAMFVGQILASVSHGYALWLGRRICVRLRSIIVAEVFTAALRRTDATNVAKAFDSAAKQVTDDPLGAAVAKAADDDEKAAAPDADANEGKILNLISVDAFSISEISAYLLYLVPECPMSIILSITFLYRLLGPSAAVGVATLVAILPVQTWLAAWFVKIQNKLLVATDARMNLVTEVLAAIRLIKFNSWEGRFYERMKETRATELGLLRTRCIAWTLQGIATSFAPAAVTCVTFAFHTKVFNQPLETETAFTALALFNMLRSPLEATTDMVAHSLSAHVSTNRVQAFLSQEQTKKYSNLTTDAGEIGFRGATLTHASTADTTAGTAADEGGFALRNLDLTFPKGELSLVAGPVGSGKTTLLLSLLGETALVKGQVLMHEHYARETAPLDAHGLSQTVAFCSQQPWLVGASVKENITFGSAWDERRYLATLKACQLERDLEIFELGDETEVGEKGTACSGGQKARISLARALYSRSATLILDDILSAVDASTAAFLFKNCLKGDLMKHRTVILVTHAVGLCLPGAAYAVVLDNGSVVAAGPPAELRSKNVFTEDELADNAEDDAHHPTKTNKANEDGVVELSVEQRLSDDPAADEAKKAQDAAKRESKRLVKEETSSSGGVSLSVYKTFVGAMGSVWFWIFLTAVFARSQGLQIEVNLWIRKWAANYDPRAETTTLLALVASPVAQKLLALGPTADDPTAAAAVAFASPTPRADSTTYYLSWYVILSTVYLASIAVRMGTLFYGSLRASTKLYDQLTRRVLGARVRFFDSTPSGRILNRFSKDISNIDQEAAPIFMYLLTSILGCISVVTVISVATPQFLFGAVFIVCLYWFIGAAYLALSRELKRIESVSRSPIFVCFGEALTGMVSIRSYGETTRFTAQMLEKVDTNNRGFLCLWAANRWLSICCDCSGSLVALFAGAFVLLNPAIDAGVAGLSLSYAITFTDFVLWVVRLYSALEISLNSVERVREYLLLEAEEEVTAKGIEPPAAWPSSEGKIEVRNLQATYAAELDPVLKDVSFTVLPHERVGICGRTGSGKSTLALTFFRFLEASSGSISIDGLDISKVSLATLRSRLAIIPQEGILLSGTIRENLDPFNLASSDYELWEALVNCRMASWSTPSASASRGTSRVTSTTDLVQLGQDGTDDDDDPDALSQITSLDQVVAAGGKNFSAGERQLLALARGLLKLRTGGSNILLLDESTANLDHHSDAAIQKTLTETLAGVTMLIIAHRLRTIIDADKVLMLDAGRVLEFDSPLTLLGKEGGAFRDLCERSGEYPVLLELAQKAHDARQAKK